MVSDRVKGMSTTITHRGTADMARMALTGRQTIGSLVRSVVIGPATKDPTCPLRERVVGAYRPNDGRWLRTLAASALLLTTLVALAIKFHGSWMYYIELIISLCT